MKLIICSDAPNEIQLALNEIHVLNETQCAPNETHVPNETQFVPNEIPFSPDFLPTHRRDAHRIFFFDDPFLK